ncbi:MAG: hypothetical protein IPL33_06370 [Sphingobacteriales bacterium]|nr:hypothetical protein [Sphingobacteriales bacterium]
MGKFGVFSAKILVDACGLGLEYVKVGNCNYAISVDVACFQTVDACIEGFQLSNPAQYVACYAEIVVSGVGQ